MPEFGKKYGKWQIIGDPIGRGGQGVVYRVLDTEKLNIENLRARVANSTLSLAAAGFTMAEQIPRAGDLAEAILAHANTEKSEFCGALKVLHSASDPAEFKKQLARMEQETQAMSALSHPNIVKIFDQHLNEGWFVTELFHEGTLAEHLDRHRGDFMTVLASFRPLVEAAAAMHAKNLVHRDIKPQNIFLSAGKLVLGDLGLVYFMDATHSRLSDTFENVGSRDWMPGWAFSMRLDEVRPSFDVFCLGKVLWSMISGKPTLPLWYLHDPRFELESMFPQMTDVFWAREILDACVVENEKDCLPDAAKLLELVDKVLFAVSRHSQVIRKGVQRICRVCGVGHYVEPPSRIVEFQRVFRIFACDACGHTELFSRGAPGAVYFG